MDAAQLKDIITAGLACQYIETDGDGRHWNALIVSPEFEGKRGVQRHQLVYATLGQRMHTDEIHALAMKTLSPAEWAAQGSKPKQ
jgi:acid stress-induced BolA-like protein IbaG/YrbA